MQKGGTAVCLPIRLSQPIPPTCDCGGALLQSVGQSYFLMNGPLPHGPGAAPLVIEDRPQGLVEILAVPVERLAEYPFLHGTDFSERAITATVADGGARFETVDAHGLECKLHHEFRSFL